MAIQNSELDARMAAEGFLNLRAIQLATGLKPSTIRRAAEKGDLTPRREGAWVYYLAEQVVFWMGPLAGPEYAPKLGVTVARAHELLASWKPRPRKAGRPRAVERLVGRRRRRVREDVVDANRPDQNPK
jgi:hypothetical protein